MDFALDRARTLAPDCNDEQYLLEISWLYNRLVHTGTQTPILDLAYELVLSQDFSQTSERGTNIFSSQIH